MKDISKNSLPKSGSICFPSFVTKILDRCILCLWNFCLDWRKNLFAVYVHWIIRGPLKQYCLFIARKPLRQYRRGYGWCLDGASVPPAVLSLRFVFSWDNSMSWRYSQIRETYIGILRRTQLRCFSNCYRIVWGIASIICLPEIFC